jgi:hypothetical protein
MSQLPLSRAPEIAVFTLMCCDVSKAAVSSRHLGLCVDSRQGFPSRILSSPSSLKRKDGGSLTETLLSHSCAVLLSDQFLQAWGPER